MKKLLVGLFAICSLSAFAGEHCEEKAALSECKLNILLTEEDQVSLKTLKASFTPFKNMCIFSYTTTSGKTKLGYLIFNRLCQLDEGETFSAKNI